MHPALQNVIAKIKDVVQTVVSLEAYSFLRSYGFWKQAEDLLEIQLRIIMIHAYAWGYVDFEVSAFPSTARVLLASVHLPEER
jgi:hypothetical protein